VNGKISKDAAIEGNTRALKAVDKLAVRYAVSPRLRVNTRNPERSKLTLALTTVTVGILTRFRNRLLRYSEYARTCTVVTLCLL
jgi:hypothetical protein